ncbi:hypothetical protein [Methylocystis sp.]|uniref:hypothetical protein n=1 Tax=Methylocystis sp. TaxID=1911079 RepID=UPI0025F2B540|nr:hypothetical protein [Methylocystis sp.]
MIAERVHSRYLRRLADLPLAGRQVRLVVIARRFRGRRRFTKGLALTAMKVRASEGED